MSVGQRTADTLVCYCYEISERHLRTTIDTIGLQTVDEIALHTGAGAGCTACHCRLRRLLAGLPARSRDDEQVRCGGDELDAIW